MNKTFPNDKSSLPTPTPTPKPRRSSDAEKDVPILTKRHGSGTGLTYQGQEVKKVGNYFLTKTLGQGAFSKVKLGIHETTEQRVAVKIMKKSRLLQEGLIEQVKREISIMKLIKHPNVVQLYEVLSSATNLYLIMELITGGEIFWIVATEKRLSDNLARKYFHQLVDAIDYCHRHGIYHRDLKPENLLLDDNRDLKISDFGLSAHIRSDNPDGCLSPSQRRKAEATLLTTRCGTPQYAAPEIIGRNGYFGPAVDIWACGVILYVFVVGNLPFDDPNEADLFKKIVQANVDYPSHLSSDVISLLKRIFVVDPKERITLPEIKLHPWFLELRDYNPNEQEQVDITNLDTATAVEPVSSANGDLENPTKKLSSMNAFDLINKAGMLNFTRLIRTTKSPVTKAPSYFTTNCEPNEVLLRIRNSLDKIPYIGYSYDAACVQLHVTGRSKTKGFLLFDVTVSKVTERIRLVDFERLSGSILEFWRIFQQLKNSCKDIVIVDSPMLNKST